MIDSILILQPDADEGLRMTHAELAELLLDLKHDLGKYIALPLAFLPADASPAQAQHALRRALLETRRAGDRVQGARALWQDFAEQVHDQLATLSSFQALQQTLARALSWEHVAAGASGDFDRGRALADLRAVAPAIQAVLEELHGQEP